MRALAIVAFAVAAAGCPALGGGPPDLALPPDLADGCGGGCSATQYCQAPCNDVLYCYAPAADGGCQHGDVVRGCFADMAPGCTFDDRPRCVSASADCQRTGSCESCAQKFGCACS